MMTDWYEQSMKALQLNGLGARTHECYTRAVRMLCDLYGKSPDLVTEEELQGYFLHRKNVDQWSPSTLLRNLAWYGEKIRIPEGRHGLALPPIR